VTSPSPTPNKLDDARTQLEAALVAYLATQEAAGVAPLLAEARATSVLERWIARRYEARQKGMSSASSAGG
jgi:hypothetical protein